MRWKLATRDAASPITASGSGGGGGGRGRSAGPEAAVACGCYGGRFLSWLLGLPSSGQRQGVRRGVASVGGAVLRLGPRLAISRNIYHQWMACGARPAARTQRQLTQCRSPTRAVVSSLFSRMLGSAGKPANCAPASPRLFFLSAQERRLARPRQLSVIAGVMPMVKRRRACCPDTCCRRCLGATTQLRRCHRRPVDPIRMQAMNRRRLALVMLGDCMLGRIVDESLSALPAQRTSVWGDVLPLLQGGMAEQGEEQLNTSNLECAVTAEEQKDESRVFNFRLSPYNVPALT